MTTPKTQEVPQKTSNQEVIVQKMIDHLISKIVKDREVHHSAIKITQTDHIVTTKNLLEVIDLSKNLMEKTRIEKEVLTNLLTKKVDLLEAIDLSKEMVKAQIEKEVLTNLLIKKVDLFKNLKENRQTLSVLLGINQIDNTNLLIKNSIVKKIVKKDLQKEEALKDLSVLNLHLKMTA
ncbi:hypothetical protein FM120_00210 [Sphingobacterium faecium PCAi_F2.5]|nr:hypothetical protein FM120_00210 [Sphingobacterium faecium PCAi_F2.5]